MKECPSPDGRNILLLAAGKRSRSLYASSLEQASKPLLPALVSKGWYLVSTWSALHLPVKKRKNRSITAILRGNVKFGCRPGVQNLLLHSTPLLLDRSGTRAGGVGWGGFPGPKHPQFLLPSLSCRSALCLERGVELNPDRPLLPSPQKGPLTHLGQLPAQLASGYCRSNPHPVFFSPHHLWHCRASLPPSSGFCSLPSCFPSVLLPQLTWQWRAN